MDCPIKTQQNKESLLDYSAGRLDRPQAGMVEEHVETCAECARFLAEQRAVWEALGAWEPAEISTDFNRRLYRKIDQAKPAFWLNRLLWRPLVPLAAACLLIAASVALHTPTATVVPENSQAHAESVEPEQVERTLDDLQMLRELALTPSSEAKTPQPM
jgi:anti-sigma factor RsiW